MSLLPIFLKLDSRPGLLVGAGNVALEKIGSLLCGIIGWAATVPAALWQPNGARPAYTI